MKAYRLLLFSMVLGAALALPLSASAAPDAAAEHDHSHGQQGAAAPADTPPSKTSLMQQAPDPQFAKQMQRMQEMHEKMMAAKTPAERRKLMGEHMKAMQEGMDMMKGLKGQPDQGGMGMMGMMGKEGMGQEGMMKMCMEPHARMKMRMEMMEMMMQMMMDQQAVMSMPK